jgi:MFS superfamily sulfate permease-like transporter
MVTQENIVKTYRTKKMLLWLLCCLIILASGIVIGAGAAILLVKHRVIWISHKPESAAAEAKEMAAKYGLNPQQTSQVEAIFSRALERRQLRREENNKKRDEDAQILTAEMQETLTPRQFERWNKHFQEVKENYKNRFKK